MISFSSCTVSTQLGSYSFGEGFFLLEAWGVGWGGLRFHYYLHSLLHCTAGSPLSILCRFCSPVPYPDHCKPFVFFWSPHRAKSTPPIQSRNHPWGTHFHYRQLSRNCSLNRCVRDLRRLGLGNCNHFHKSRYKRTIPSSRSTLPSVRTRQ